MLERVHMNDKVGFMVDLVELCTGDCLVRLDSKWNAWMLCDLDLQRGFVEDREYLWVKRRDVRRVGKTNVYFDVCRGLRAGEAATRVVDWRIGDFPRDSFYDDVVVMNDLFAVLGGSKRLMREYMRVGSCMLIWEAARVKLVDNWKCMVPRVHNWKLNRVYELSQTV